MKNINKGQEKSLNIIKTFSIAILVTLFLSVPAYAYQVDDHIARLTQEANNRQRSVYPTRVIILPSAAREPGLRTGVNTSKYIR